MYLDGRHTLGKGLSLRNRLQEEKMNYKVEPRVLIVTGNENVCK